MTKSFKLEFVPDPEQYARAVASQRATARDIASRLERGEPISDLPGQPGQFAAAILRLWADTLPDAPPRKRGQAPKIDPAAVALHYEGLVRQGRGKLAAQEELAGVYGVSSESIRKALEKYGKDAKALFDFGTT